MIGIGAHKRKPHEVNLGHKGSFEIKRPGALHEMLGIPQDETIPTSKLEIHPGDSELLKHRKASAKGLKAMHH